MLGKSTTELLELAATARSSSQALFAPYLDGERAPLWRSDIRALFAGLGSGDGPPELARAVFRGVALTGNRLLDLAAKGTGQPAGQIHITGRGATNPIWQEIRLEASGQPLDFHTEPFSSALGAAMLGAAAAGQMSLVDAQKYMASPPTRVTPSSRQIEASHVLQAQFARASIFAEGWNQS